ncbi:MAG: hypothetical protein ABFS56_04840 [Pseudomonadota bacterium]
MAIGKVVKLLGDWLKDSEFVHLRRDIMTWLLRVVLPKNAPNVQIPEVVNFQEMNTMLYETMQGWYQTAEERGQSSL